MKRIFDTLCAFLGSVILLPVFLVIAAGVKLSSPGPILYKQRRIGLNCTPFTLYKFRTMVRDADKIGSSITTIHDARVTKFGETLRKLKLDELPQLWNVLKGDMSLVGPRPDVPEIVNTYSPNALKILTIRPGITSIASLHLRNEAQILAHFSDPEAAYLQILVPAKIDLAMEHVYRNSLRFDIWILLLTIWMLTLGHRWPIPEHPMVAEILSIEAQND